MWFSCMQIFFYGKLQKNCTLWVCRLQLKSGHLSVPGSERFEIQSEIPHHIKDMLNQFFLVVRSELIVFCIVCIGNLPGWWVRLKNIAVMKIWDHILWRLKSHETDKRVILDVGCGLPTSKYGGVCTTRIRQMGHISFIHFVVATAEDIYINSVTKQIPSGDWSFPCGLFICFWEWVFVYLERPILECENSSYIRHGKNFLK